MLAATAGCGNGDGTHGKPNAEEVSQLLAGSKTVEQQVAAASEQAARDLRDLYEVSVKQSAVDALGRMGEPAVPALTAALANPDPELRAYAALAIARMGPTAADAVDALAVALDDPDARVRQSAARALGQIGPAANRAIPDLIRLLTDPD